MNSTAPIVVATAHPILTAITPAPTPTSSAATPASPGSPSPSASGGLSAPVEPTESGSPSPTPTPAEIRITDIAINEVPGGGTRLTLTMSGGPVSFEWHRLADPDNRYWLDIKGVTLASPAQTMTSGLPFVKDIRITQFSTDPERIVRVAIEPTQPIDVNIGAVAQSSNQMGIQIERTPPGPDAAKSGVGSIAWIMTPPPPVRTVTQRDLIAIDPGHGGNDPGSMNAAYGLVESKLTLEISLRLRDELRKLGWRVVMTRDANYEVGDPNGDDHQELQARCDVANAAGARIFVSVHINASVARSLNGTTTYYWRTADRALAQAIQSALIAADGIKDMGVRREQFYVIHHTTMPSALVETAFLSNPHDASLLQDSAFLDKLASGIAKGIMDYTGGPQAPL
jgi:N-acetylmuramoyl-L-alanine amidase